jgi:hypothetical protein
MIASRIVMLFIFLLTIQLQAGTVENEDSMTNSNSLGQADSLVMFHHTSDEPGKHTYYDSMVNGYRQSDELENLADIYLTMINDPQYELSSLVEDSLLHEALTIF